MPPKLPQPQVRAILALVQQARLGIAQARTRQRDLVAVSDAEYEQMHEEISALRADVDALQEHLAGGLATQSNRSTGDSPSP